MDSEFVTSFQHDAAVVVGGLKYNVRGVVPSTTVNVCLRVNGPEALEEEYTVQLVRSWYLLDMLWVYDCGRTGLEKQYCRVYAPYAPAL